MARSAGARIHVMKRRRRTPAQKAAIELAARSDFLLDEVLAAERMRLVWSKPLPTFLPPPIRKLMERTQQSIRKMAADRSDYEIEAVRLSDEARRLILEEESKRPQRPPRRKTGREMHVPPPATAEDET